MVCNQFAKLTCQPTQSLNSRWIIGSQRYCDEIGPVNWINMDRDVYRRYVRDHSNSDVHNRSVALKKETEAGAVQQSLEDGVAQMRQIEMPATLAALTHEYPTVHRTNA